jgi:hypothetical protein
MSPENLQTSKHFSKYVHMMGGARGKEREREK